jgi:exodeoxyribonuclease VII large subunit
MSQVLTVSEFVEAVNLTLDTLDLVTIEGEVSEFKIIHNKWVTFSLKDADSSVGCFMTLWQYRAQIEDGMLVRASGRPRLRPKGFFSFVVEGLQPSGEGALRRAFLLLHDKLQAEGLFSAERKRPLPRWPQHIALITSRDAAAYSDFIKVLGERIGGLTISFIHTQVQGGDAPRQIIDALQTANTDLEHVDVVVLVRGGGSLEDLQAFNDEGVVRAVAASRTPIIVGIGHERDTCLAEMAADVRASTPSNAAELLSPSRQEIAGALEYAQTRLINQMTAHVADQHNTVAAAISRLQHQLTITTTVVKERLHIHQASLRQQLLLTLANAKDKVADTARLLRSLSPQQTLKRGYSITRDREGVVIKSAGQVASGSLLTSQLADGTVESKVI